jgi:hypothetical protein
MNYEKNRKGLYNDLKKDGVTRKDYPTFKKAYYDNKPGFEKLWDVCVEEKYYTPDKEKKFYEAHACDYNWAKSVSHCSDSTTTIEKCQKDIKSLTDKGYTRVTQEYYESKTEDAYYKQRYFCKANNQYSYYLKSKKATSDQDGNSDDNVSPGPVNTRYQDCTGKKTRFNGCRDTDGIISKVQGCIGVKQDGYFGPKTESALQAKTGKEVFTTDDVESICKGSESPEIFMPMTTEDKVEYFRDLAKKNRIYPKGIIHKRPNGDVAYVIKYVNQEPSPLDSSLSLGQQVNMGDIEKGSYDVIYHFAPKTKKDQGIWTRLIVDTRYGEKKLKLQTPDEDMTWEPDPEMDTDIFMESKLKSILKNVLLEQQYEGLNVKIPNRKSNVSGNQGQGNQAQGQPGGQTTTGGGTSQTQQGSVSSQNTTTFDRDSETIKAVGNIKNRAIKIIDSWDQYNDGLKLTLKNGIRFGLKGELNKNIDSARDEINSVDPKDFCDTEIQERLESKKKELERQKKEKTDLLTNEDKVFITQLEGIFNEIKVACKKVDDLESQSLQSSQGPQTQQSTQTQQGSSSTTSQTQQGSSNTSTTTQTNKPEELTQNEPTELSEEQCRNLVVQYLYGAISTSMYGNVGTEMATGKILEPNVIKNRMCGCRIKYGFDNIKIKKDDFTGKYQLDPKLLKFGSNDVLNWKEIKELIQTGVDKKFFRTDKGELTIGRKYRDSSFGEAGMCKGQINESISKTVKSHIFEVINKKKKLTESIVNKITKRIG